MYQNFAAFYDRYFKDVDYIQLANFLEDVFARSGHYINKKPELVLDLGCGTGNMTFELAARGYDMIGLDISEEMLQIASGKETSSNILWINQDMCDFELFGTVGAIVCFLDGINHITSKWDFKRLFKLVNNYLDPGGVFVFDLLSEYYFKYEIGNNVFCESDDDGSCFWSSKYDEKKKLCQYDITCYTKIDEQNDLFKRSDDTNLERAWSYTDVYDAASDAGLKLCNIEDSRKYGCSKNSSYRNYFCFVKGW